MRTSFSLLLPASLLLASLLLPVNASGLRAAETGGIAVENAWARPTIGAGLTSAAYFTVTDKDARDRLVSASTPVAAIAELHETIDDKGVMKMRKADGLALEPGKPARLAPGGYHLMLMGLKQPLKAGDTFPLTLRFEHAPEMTVNVAVQASAASQGAGMPMGQGGGHPSGAPK